jgi:hypothetical protein
VIRRSLPLLRSADASLPPLHARWLEAILADPSLPDETHATCDDCAMLADPSLPPGALAFSPDTRCCTYLPTLANFLVGGALRDASPHGAASVRQRLSEGDGLSPLGLTVDPALVAAQHADRDRFGRDASLRCPHYEPVGGRCGVWAWREATCATWFCKHTRGERAKALWNRLHQLLARLERAVAWHCAVALDIPPEALARMAPLDRPHGAPRADVLASDDALWGRWSGDVEGYFLACAALAEALTPAEVLSLGGAEARALAATVRLAQEQLLDDALPARVALGRVQLAGISAASVRVQGYSHLDPLEVPRALFDQLHHFDGRPIEEALRDASAAAGEEVPSAAVGMLVDFDILRRA